MGGKLDLFRIGQAGVNVSKNALQLSDDEATQLQNVSLTEENGALSKRRGLSVLNGSALAGSVSGLSIINLLSTYTRTLMFPKGTEDSTTWVTTTDGTSLSNTSTPAASADFDKYTDETTERDARRITAYRNYVYYPGNSYTQDTDNPEINVWDNTASYIVTRIPIGPSSNGSPAYAITDMITANGRIYIAVHDPDGTNPDLIGRVLEYNPETSLLQQVGNAFGAGTGEMTGGYPSALCWHLGQLFVGLNGAATTNGIGKIVRIRPGFETSFTSDVANLVSHISSLCVFQGNMFVGTRASATTGARLIKRTASTGAYTTILTSASGAGDGHYACIYEHNSALWAVEYFSGGTDVVHIITSADGTSWSTSRDVDANDSPADPPQLPGAMMTLGSDLFVTFRATDVNNNDGFIMRFRSAAWSKLATDNYAGPAVVQTVRS